MELSKLAIKRLTILRDFMRKLPKSAEDHFDMIAWYKHEGLDHNHLAKDGTITCKTLTGCGTSACAAGWAATIPSFRRAGFKYRPGALTDGFTMTPERFFDLESTDDGIYVADDIFYAYDISTPKEWAKRATEILKKARTPR